MLISRIKKGKSKRWPVEQNVVVGLIMRTHDGIEINPDIMFGKPVIRNTRITVEQILRKLAGGMTLEEIIPIILILS